MLKNYSAAYSKDSLIQRIPELQMKGKLATSYNRSRDNICDVIVYKETERLVKMQWGLVPSWSEYNITAKGLLSARREDVMSSPTFRIPIRSQRCLIPIDSYYCWVKRGNKNIPYRVFSKIENALFVAGVWDCRESRDNVQYTFAMIEREASKSVTDISYRMPQILNEEQIHTWLSDINVSEIVDILATPYTQNLHFHKVDDKLSDPKFNASSLHVPQEDVRTLFDI